jgi:ubiquitin carboxyl-terminal hydrolase MINDY-1/2
MVEEALERLKGQRHETYQIKHFNWFDHNTGFLRRSSMLTQNKNGPCPLLALVNALILAKCDDSQSALGCALQAREQVSLGLLIESLMDELTTENQMGALETLPDVDEINRFLVMLHTGMNANPRFVPPPAPPPNLMDARNSVLHLPTVINDDLKPGTFEQTRDLTLYGAFAVPLVHGWLPKRSEPARAAFARAAPTYEDAQTIQFGEEELEGKLSQGGLTSEEQQLWEDIVSIKTFLNAHPTQITPFGLDVVTESLFPGAFAIMFRNDHFSAIYKHPQSGQLFTLVTDAGYADKDEVIWESLVDVSGSRSEFFSGDFRPVGGAEGHADTSQQTSTPLAPSSAERRSSSQYLAATHSAAPLSPQEIQEQHDADFAMALQLQEEEESRANSSSRRHSTQTRSSNADRPSNIPIRLRPQPDTGPAIPPRTSRSTVPAVNRPVNSTDEAPPPTYDEAAKGRPYIPPPGHPQHPSSDPSPRSSTTTVPITPVATSSSQQPRPIRVPQQRRMSAFQENQQHYSPRHENMRSSSNQHIGPVASGSRQRDRGVDKDCIVM